jgi:hypothetical protein
MSKYADETLGKIREAYAEAVTEAPNLSRWEDLPLVMREAFIAVFFAGRKSSQAEEMEYNRLRFPEVES